MELDFDILNTAIWVYDIDKCRIIWANKSALALWDSATIDELSRRDFRKDLSDAVEQALRSYQRGFLENKTYQENWHFTPNNKKVKAHCRFSGIKLKDDRMGMLVEAFEINNPIYHSSDITSVIVSLFSASGYFISANPPFTEVYGNAITRLENLVDDEEITSNILNVIEQKSEFETDVLLTSTSGRRWYHIHASCSQDASGHSAVLLHNYDIHERKVAELSLIKQTTTDPLTGLLNREGIAAAVKNRIASYDKNNDTSFSILYLDLDGFKMINDSFGHALGDLLLMEVAERLGKNQQHGIEISRFGGDEFVIFVESLTSAIHISSFCDKLQNELSKPFKCIPGHLQVISASIGCATYPRDGNNLDQLISRADAAMYYAKNEGKKQYRIYKPEMELTLKRASNISRKLMTAIQDNILSLHYQPIVNVTHAHVESFEALLRWKDEELGDIYPEEIIEIAENTGLIQVVEQWVFRRALTDLTALRNIYGSKVVMSINMSGTHLAKIGSGNEISTLLSQSGLVGTDIRIELTEATFVENFDRSGEQATTLISCGVNFSIDDFGTGYSSLAYLHKIPAKTLKVDRSFVKIAPERPVILQSILNMATECQMLCIVEGVETKEESQFLRELGFHLQQGFIFAKPQPLSSLLCQNIDMGAL